MKKFVSDWMEGNGMMQAWIRTLMMWVCPTKEQTKLYLLKIVDEKKDAFGPYILQYAIDRRRKQIHWFLVYLPFFAFSILGVLLMAGAFISQNPRQIYFTLAVILSLVVIFRGLWVSLYMEGYQLICLAANDIWIERLTSTAAKKAFPIPHSDIKTEMEQLPTRQIEKADPQEVEGNLSQPGKGAILMCLLHELIKKEAQRPNIYNGEIHKTVLLYADLSGCQPKNILNRVKYYKSRNSIVLATENSKTTHRKYLEKLQQHYVAIGDDELNKTAEDLLLFIIKNSGKKTQ